MKDRQVEVVAGGHVVARVAGAVLLVAHRDGDEPTADSPAVLALESLAGLVRAAAEQRPDEPGAVIAREAARWLMKHAERISPGLAIEFGILSPAGTEQVAIFLHGAVTAVVAGEQVEHYRGSDAAFTVDRAVPTPSHAVALFADDSDGRIPDLPAERGIGWLVEGIAPGRGVIVWSDAARHRPPSPATPADHSPRPADRDDTGSVPTARLDPAQPRERPATPNQPVDPDSTPTEAATSLLDMAEEPTPDLHHAPTEQGGPELVPQPNPELRRRTEATAKGAALTVKVLGFTCARAHPTDPRSAFCSVCGMPVDQTQPLLEVVRPPLGMLVLDDGSSHVLTVDTVLGRDPEHSEQAMRGLAPLKVDDSSGGMSRAHAELLLIDWDVTLLDRGSTNGTRTRMAGYRDWVRLTPNQPMVLVPGTEILIGNRVLRFEPLAPPPFG